MAGGLKKNYGAGDDDPCLLDSHLRVRATVAAQMVQAGWERGGQRRGVALQGWFIFGSGPSAAGLVAALSSPDFTC